MLYNCVCFRRLSKDTVAQVGEKLATLMNMFPLSGSEYIIQKVQENLAFIEPVVEIMKSFNGLSLDVFTCRSNCLVP